MNETKEESKDKESEKSHEYDFPGTDADLENHPEWKETTHPDQRKAGHREFSNEKTGEKIRFDKGNPTETGHEAHDHYHRYNPNSKSRHDGYLDRYGNPVRRGSDASHLYPPNGIYWNFK